MFTNPQEIYNNAVKYMSAFPKTIDEVQEFSKKVRAVVDAEINNAKEIIGTYNKATKGDASINEIMSINKKAQEMMVAARFATVLAIPGGAFMVPLLVEASREYDFDFVPASVSKEFNI